MKKLLVIVLSLGLIVPVTAQVVKQQQQKVKSTRTTGIKLTPEKYAQDKVQHLNTQVELSAEQKEQLTAMYKSLAPKRIGAIGNDAQTISEVNQEEIKRRDMILNQEQRAQLQALEAKKQQHRIDNAGKRPVNRSSAEVDQPRAPLTDALRK